MQPLVSLSEVAAADCEAGRSPAAHIARSDAICESAWQITYEARLLWCRTASESDFLVYQAYANGLLAADCMNEGLRTLKVAHINDAAEYLGVATQRAETATTLILEGR